MPGQALGVIVLAGKPTADLEHGVGHLGVRPAIAMPLDQCR